MVHMSCVKKEFLSLRHILNEVLTDEIIQCLRFAIFNIYFYLFDCTGSPLQHVGSLTFDEAYRIFSCGMWDLFFLSQLRTLVEACMLTKKVWPFVKC